MGFIVTFYYRDFCFVFPSAQTHAPTLAMPFLLLQLKGACNYHTKT